MSLHGRSVLLTGGTGFIGSRLARRLAAERADLRLLVRPSSRGDLLGPLWDKFPRLVADLNDPASLAAAVRSADPEFVFHLAKDREGSSFEREARATTALASALGRHAPRLKRWVRTAHAAPEGLGRGADVQIARTLAERFKLPVATLELYLVYGPGQKSGDYPLDLVEAELAGGLESAPAEEKDLVFVEDVVDAYLLAAQSPKAVGAWIPVGGGRLVPGVEAARAAMKAAGRAGAIEGAGAPRPGGHPADLRLAKDLLGWAPRTSLDEGMRRAAEWLKETRHG